MPYTDDVTEVKCPRCGGRMWDNRATKKNPKAPDYKCRDNQCLDPKSGMVTAIWEKDVAAPPRAQPAVKPVSTSGVKEPYSSGARIPGIDGPVDSSKLDALFTVYGLCMDHVLETIVPKLDAAKIGASPESVGAMTATLLIQAAKL